MSSLLRKPSGTTGKVVDITPEDAGLAVCRVRRLRVEGR